MSPMCLRRGLAAIALGALCLVLVCGQAHGITSVRHRPRATRKFGAADINKALARIDSQIEATLSTDRKLDAMPDGSVLLEKDAKAKPAEKKDKASKDAALNVKLKNMLDLKSLATTIEPGVAAAQPRHVVVAFISIAYETVHRAYAAIGQLNHAWHVGLSSLKIMNHDMYAWLANQKAHAEFRISSEQKRIARLSDEVAHLQHVYQDAMAKKKAYEMQAKNLVSERQLQTTPPLIPSVAATALTDGQYKSALSKLETFRQKAIRIIDQTAKAIAVRNHVISLASQWVVNSKAKMKAWMATQQQLIEKKKKKARQQLALLLKRKENVKILMNDAIKKHKQYVKVLHILDIEHHMSVLKSRQLKYKGIVTTNAYDRAHQIQYLKALKLELASLEAKKKQLGGDTKVKPPPSAWGILAGFSHPHYHNWHMTNFHHVPPPGVDPHAPAIIYNTQYLNNGPLHKPLPTDPSVAWYQAQGSFPMPQLAAGGADGASAGASAGGASAASGGSAAASGGSAASAAGFRELFQTEAAGGATDTTKDTASEQTKTTVDTQATAGAATDTMAAIGAQVRQVEAETKAALSQSAQTEAKVSQKVENLANHEATELSPEALRAIHNVDALGSNTPLNQAVPAAGSDVGGHHTPAPPVMPNFPAPPDPRTFA